MVVALELLFEGGLLLLDILALFDIKNPEGLFQIGNISWKVGMIDAEQPREQKKNHFAFLGRQMLKDIPTELIVGEKNLFILLPLLRS